MFQIMNRGAAVAAAADIYLTSLILQQVLQLKVLRIVNLSPAEMQSFLGEGMCC